jgi:hypothetical protein
VAEGVKDRPHTSNELSLRLATPRRLLEKLRVHGQVGKARALGSLMQVALDLTQKNLPPVPSCIPSYPPPGQSHTHFFTLPSLSKVPTRVALR